MTWTQEDMEGDAEVSVWMFHQKRQRKKKIFIFALFVVTALLATWIFTVAMSTAANMSREHDKWLKDNGCKVVSHRDGEWKYHFFGDYYEHIPSETCYRCKKTGEEFCE